MRSLIAAVVIFSLAFIVCAGTLGALWPRRAQDFVAAKLEQIANSPMDYDVVFIGDSHVNRHVVPEVFDAEMANRGHDLRGYNLGAHGMSIYETHYVLRQILNEEPSSLKFVVIDISNRWLVQNRNFSTSRVIAWHDLPGLVLALDHMPYQELSLREEVTRISRHLGAFVTRMTYRGVGSSWLRIELAGSNSGERFLEGYRGGFIETYQKVFGWLPKFRKERSQLANHEVVVRPLSPGTAALFEDMVRLTRENGVEAIFVFPPLLYSSVRFIVTPDGEPAYPLFLFNDPNAYPTLYEDDKRMDPGHLNTEGARAYSAIFAERLAKYLDGDEI